MKKMLAFAVALTAAHWASAAQPLLTPAQLSAQLPAAAQVRVIDIRDPKAYGQQHIPGAVNAPYGKWRGPATNPGELPDVSQLTQLVQSLGLTPTVHAVVVSTGADATDFGASARVYWTLKTLGLKELSIVNGGMKAWTDAKLPLDNAAVKIAASNWQPALNTELIATRDDIRQHLDLSNAALVDSRPDAFYQGKTRAPAAKLSGTLPGAQQLDFNQWFVPGTSIFVDAAAAKQIAAKVQRQSGQDMVAFCNTGHWAATDWFGLSEMAGLPNVKLYAGSMVDWTQQPGTPALANQPSRFESLAYDARQWWQSKVK
ncbi:rhodanese-like domain-containing protein [Acidovorax sp. Be4]|uniref:Rhodanese-like domain-containing protein n=1 Tax=Acidovorax bellezanensis TaxID=2976702 RepID=A0ABT2PHR4_9BURK|nr:rhodanese-like domain-containing protein [Acidovorax sp. Be4]MCT9809688.1 rhodanese-like domain-containing protein [Acidovorax sp. Be4]